MDLKKFIFKIRRLITIALHLVLVILAYILSFYLRFDFKLTEHYWQLIISTLPILIIIKFIIFAFFKLYSGLWRYAGIDDIWRIFKANILSTLCFFLALGFYLGRNKGIFSFSGFPRSVFIIDFVFSLGFISGIRFFNRLIREKFRPEIRVKRRTVLVIGAGEAG